MDTQLLSSVDALRSIALPDIILVDDLAAHCHCRPSTIRSYLRAGLIPGRRLGRRWYIPRRELLNSLVAPSALIRALPKGGVP